MNENNYNTIPALEERGKLRKKLPIGEIVSGIVKHPGEPGIKEAEE